MRSQYNEKKGRLLEHCTASLWGCKKSGSNKRSHGRLQKVAYKNGHKERVKRKQKPHPFLMPVPDKVDIIH